MPPPLCCHYLQAAPALGQGDDCDMGHFCAGEPDTTTTAMVLYSDNEEAVEWVNMCWRKV